MSNLSDFFGWLLILSSITTYIFPILPFIKACKNSIDYEETPHIDMTIKYHNCLIWYIYGLIINSRQIKICNFLGCVISLLCIITYLFFEIRKNFSRAVLTALIIYTGSRVFYIKLTDNLEEVDFLGKISFIISLTTLLNPIYLIIRVIIEKNYKIISKLESLISSFDGFCWIIYGSIENNKYVVYANILKTVIANLQLIFYIHYKIKIKENKIENIEIYTIREKEKEKIIEIKKSKVKEKKSVEDVKETTKLIGNEE